MVKLSFQQQEVDLCCHVIISKGCMTDLWRMIFCESLPIFNNLLVSQPQKMYETGPAENELRTPFLELLQRFACITQCCFNSPPQCTDTGLPLLCVSSLPETLFLLSLSAVSFIKTPKKKHTSKCNTIVPLSPSAEHVGSTVDRRGRARADCPPVNQLLMVSFSQMDQKIKRVKC